MPIFKLKRMKNVSLGTQGELAKRFAPGASASCPSTPRIAPLPLCFNATSFGDSCRLKCSEIFRNVWFCSAHVNDDDDDETDLPQSIL